MFEFSPLKSFKNRKINIQFREDIEPQEIFLDGLALKKEEEIGISAKKFETPLGKKILRIFYLSCLFLMMIFFIKTFYLQIIQGEEFNILAQRNKAMGYLIRPERGVIYDRNLVQLVWNQPSFDLIIDKRDLPREKGERIKILKKISEIIGRSFENLKAQIENSNFVIVPIYENIGHQKLILLKTTLEEFPGLSFEENTVRSYKDGPVFSPLIGHTGRISKDEWGNFENYLITDYIGKTGLEKFYEKELRGKTGQFIVKRDARGRKQSKEIISISEPGKSLKLWLDFELQQKLKSVLEATLNKTGVSKATAIALDPRTGGVLSLVNIPSFDNNLLSKGIEQKRFQEKMDDPLKPFFNRAISGEYLIGSIIKPLVALAALEEGIIHPDRKIYSPLSIYLKDRYYPDIIYRFKDWKYHGWLDMRRAIAVSSNVYFYKIGGGYKNYKGVGVEKIADYLKLFNWGQKTNIDLTAEAEGFIPDTNWRDSRKKNWHLGHTYHLSIGQGYISVTPIQIASIFGAIANKGVLYQPQVVKEIISNSAQSKETIKKISPKIVRENFVDIKNLQVIREGMRKAVTHGTATMLNNISVKVAAKTGTAQTAQKGVYHNLITVFAPYDNPEIVLFILIEEIEGMRAPTLPVAREVLEWYFTR